MLLEDIHILSADIEGQARFYGEQLGLPCRKVREDLLRVTCGENRLWLHASPGRKVFYHFAFLIPTGSLEWAIAFAKEHKLKILYNKGEIITHFDKGRAVYFEDADRNIAEFIERPLVDYPGKRHFQISDLIKINEIGCPSPEPLRLAETLCEEYGIVPMARQRFDDGFCWVGDHEGVILVPKVGRHWLPTERPAIPSPAKVVYSSEGESYCYRHHWPFDD